MDVCEPQRLYSQGVLDLARRSESPGGLVEELALAGHPGDRLQAQRSHGNEQQYDQQECAEKFCVDGDLDSRHPASQ